MEAKAGVEPKLGTEARPWSELKDRATLIETRIAHEINLMGQRMTWLVTSQAFLFAAWVQLVKGGSMSSDAGLLFYVIPSVGLGVSVAGWIAIVAAMIMVDMLVIDRAAVDDLLDLTPMSPLRRSHWTRLAGHVPTEVLPPLFVTAWLVVVAHQLSGGVWIDVAAASPLPVWLVWRGLTTWKRHQKSKTLAYVKAAGNIDFRTARIAAEQVKVHGGELPSSEVRGPGATVAEFMASAQKTIGKATATKLLKTGRRQIEFLREVTEGGKVYRMAAIVNVTDDGKAYLESYKRDEDT